MNFRRLHISRFLPATEFKFISTFTLFSFLHMCRISPKALPRLSLHPSFLSSFYSFSDLSLEFFAMIFSFLCFPYTSELFSFVWTSSIAVFLHTLVCHWNGSRVLFKNITFPKFLKILLCFSNSPVFVKLCLSLGLYQHFYPSGLTSISVPRA